MKTQILLSGELVKIIVVCAFVLITFSAVSQNSSGSNNATMQNKYIILKVTNDILDCPHFGMLIPQVVEQKLYSNVIDKNPIEKYLIVHTTNNNLTEEEYRQKFTWLLDSIQFPKTSIKEIIISNENPYPSK